VRRVNGIAVLYAPFSRVRIVSELASMFSPVGLLWAVRAKQPNRVVFYNRQTAYLPTLLVSKLLGNKNFLDLEDGEVAKGAGLTARLLVSCVKRAFDTICNQGALLACSALREFTAILPTQCYYGTASSNDPSQRFQSESVSVLMGGTLSPETGAELLINAIGRMRSSGAGWTSELTIQVTGTGPSLEGFQALAAVSGFPRLVVHGRTTNSAYESILRKCDVGLALKLHAGALAETTFPSKVIEYAAAGMLVLTTDISDVRLALGEGALYLSHDSSEQLEALLERVVREPSHMQRIAQQGCERVRELCSPESAGQVVAAFLTGAQE
jgi:glycosyltransferase involved in cell wall biosynthesis